ncbi:IS256 family transposase [Syntrophorhabdus aromaticivorans]|uniref:IS256 family transposase n=1 Tax=Syntrophorhabdus aromaticivorans TaxID=328301 RepID=UPI0004024AD4|nr:IS256 family transposase [Syntrophorhabdus aromaticivorans]
MKVNTKQRKKANKGFERIYGKDEMAERMFHILRTGKQGIDTLVKELGIMMAEAIMDMEREELSGPEYLPRQEGVYKWAYQRGSIYIGDQKVPVRHPRLRGPEGEIPLQSYRMLKEPERFSEELLNKMLRGVSTRKYQDTILDTAHALGVSPSSVSRHIVAVTSRNLAMFKERDLTGRNIFAVFIDTIHRAGDAYMVSLGLDREGVKHVLGFWQGATENHEICEELLADMERRGLTLSKNILWVTDGGKGVIKTLRDRFGKKLIHQRCTIHKDRNIQKHLAKKYRKQAHRRFTVALEQNDYQDARQMLLDFEKWLRAINESAADSLMEAIEEILTLHRLKMPGLLRKTLTSTNPIESMFSTVRDCERNIKRYRGSAMAQRWLASVLFHCEKGFRRIKGYRDIPQVLINIEALQNEAALQTAA